MAREGLRTLVFGKRVLSEAEYSRWLDAYTGAKAAVVDRGARVLEAQALLEVNMALLGLSGVEDLLQENLGETLEMLRNAGIQIWMLTGDKIETATCIAISSRLVARHQGIFTFSVATVEEASSRLDQFSTRTGDCLIIDGHSLALCLGNVSLRQRFTELACAASVVVCSRCSPTQKAEVVTLVKEHTGKRCAAVGDGGNDVAMINAAHVGIGLEGKEGRQASLAADFSLTQFSFIARLILWHGRNAYRRSARLGQFIIHRGLIITVMQAVFSSLFFYAAVPIYNGLLMVCYATVFTMLPVFGIVLDEDVSADTIFLYPQIYADSAKGKSLNHRTFLSWVWKSVFSGGVLMLLSIMPFFNPEQQGFVNLVSVTFSALVLSLLIAVAMEIHKWTRFMVVAMFLTLVVYGGSLFLFPETFPLAYILSTEFVVRTLVLTLSSVLPISVLKYYRRWRSPPVYEKLK